MFDEVLMVVDVVLIVVDKVLDGVNVGLGLVPKQNKNRNNWKV